MRVPDLEFGSPADMVVIKTVIGMAFISASLMVVGRPWWLSICIVGFSSDSNSYLVLQNHTSKQSTYFHKAKYTQTCPSATISTWKFVPLTPLFLLQNTFLQLPSRLDKPNSKTVLSKKLSYCEKFHLISVLVLVFSSINSYKFQVHVWEFCNLFCCLRE